MDFAGVAGRDAMLEYRLGLAAILRTGDAITCAVVADAKLKAAGQAVLIDAQHNLGLGSHFAPSPVLGMEHVFTYYGPSVKRNPSFMDIYFRTAALWPDESAQLGGG